MPQPPLEFVSLVFSCDGGTEADHAQLQRGLDAAWEWLTRHAQAAVAREVVEYTPPRARLHAHVQLRVHKNANTIRRLLAAAAADGCTVPCTVGSVTPLARAEFEADVDMAMHGDGDAASPLHRTGDICSSRTRTWRAPRIGAEGGATITTTAAAAPPLAPAIAILVANDRSIVHATPLAPAVTTGGGRVEQLVRLQRVAPASTVLTSKPRCVGDELTRQLAVHTTCESWEVCTADGSRIPFAVSIDASRWVDCVDGVCDVQTVLETIRALEGAAALARFEACTTLLRGGMRFMTASPDSDVPVSRAVLALGRTPVYIRLLKPAPPSHVLYTEYNVARAIEGGVRVNGSFKYV